MARYDERTALIIVDIQNDFADSKGSLAVAGGADVVAVANREADAAREAGALVVYSQDWHPESTPHFEKDGGIWPVHCVAESWGAAFHPALRVDGPLVRKGKSGEDGYSAFTIRDPRSGRESRTELPDLLKERRVAKLVIVGLATDYCVKDTALDGLAMGFLVTVVREGVRAVDLEPGDGEKALTKIIQAGGTVA